MMIMNTVDKKPALDVQIRHAMEAFEDRFNNAATLIYCHPTEKELYDAASNGLTIVPILISKNVYWLGDENV